MRYIVIVILLLSSAACIEPFDYGIGSYQRNLVVEASLSDEVKFHQVRLTFTAPITQDEELPVSGAAVSISSNSGETILYEEISSGIYQTIQEVGGKAGAKYQLNITLNDGSQYESSEEMIPNSDPITSLYARYESVASAELNRNEGGIQFFLDTESNGGTGFYRYEWEETYQIVVPFPSELKFNLADSTLVERNEIISRCFQTVSSNELLIANSISNDLNNIRAFPLHFIGNELESDGRRRLRYRYSLLAKQYKLSGTTYEYYRKLKESNESGGSLFDEQQGAITGNIVSLSDNNEAVLGNFEASSLTTFREFFNPDNFDSPFERPESATNCPFEVFFSPPIDSLPNLIQGGFFDIYKLTEGFPEVLYVGPTPCVRCDDFANPNQPEFWTD